MYLLQDYQRQVNGFIRSRSPRAFTAGGAVTILVLGAVAGAFLWMGTPPMNGLPWDTSVTLDGAWRVFNGQIPNKDFFLVDGSLHLYMTALGMKLGHPGISAIVWGNYFILAATALSGFLILRRRTSAFYTAVFTVFAAVMAITPRAFGEPHDATGYVTLYNRYGEAFLALLGAILFLPPTDDAKKGWPDWIEGSFAGFCIPLLLLCKLNYFVIGIGFFLLASLAGRFRTRYLVAAVVSAIAFSALTFGLTHNPPLDLWRDARIIAASQSLRARLPRIITEGVRNSFYVLILVALGWEMARKEQAFRVGQLRLAVMVLISISGLMIIGSNAQSGEVPLFALGGLYAAEIIRRQSEGPSLTDLLTTVRNLGAALLLAYLVWPTLGEDLETVRYAAHVTAQKEYYTPRSLESTPLKDWRFCASGSRHFEMSDFADTLDEGMDLLRRHADAKDKFVAFLFFDPFHMALESPPCEGGVNCWSWIGINELSHPPLNRLIGGARYILAGTGPDLSDEYGANCREPFPAEWDQLHLQIIDKTKHLTLLKVPDSNEKSESGKKSP